jgi:hypothetical protein
MRGVRKFRALPLGRGLVTASQCVHRKLHRDVEYRRAMVIGRAHEDRVFPFHATNVSILLQRLLSAANHEWRMALICTKRIFYFSVDKVSWAHSFGF